MPTIERKSYGKTHEGEPVDEIVLTNANGTTATLLTYGATLASLVLPNREGEFSDVLLGFDNLRQWEFESPYFGCAVGRFANRIANGAFQVDGIPYATVLNDGLNHLHGGFKGYDKRVWKAETAMMGGPTVKFSLLDPDGTEGYPGNVNVQVFYTLLPGDTIRIQYLATTDKATPINLTNHAYFNLKDGGATTIESHTFQAEADAYTPVDESLTPTGETLPVEGTPIDFRKPKALGKDLKAMGGYDHNLVLRSRDGSLALAGVVEESKSGRRMEVWTTQPGVQLYTGNFLDGSVTGRGGIAYQRHAAFCLETQHFPDSPNRPEFPNTILRPGEVYRQVTEYRFSVSG
ncbi:MAG TPA: aldose epimerase family protein [Fimbriimonas sp.]